MSNKYIGNVRADISIHCDDQKINVVGDGSDSWLTFRFEEGTKSFLTLFLDYAPETRLFQLSHLEEQLVEHIDRLKRYVESREMERTPPDSAKVNDAVELAQDDIPF